MKKSQKDANHYFYYYTHTLYSCAICEKRVPKLSRASQTSSCLKEEGGRRYICSV